ncbi:MAG: FAD-binding protein [Sulfitobacter sp.]
MKITSEEMLSEVIAQAEGPFSIRGGDTRGMAGQGTPLEMSGLAGITLYDPGALTMVAQAGTDLAEIETVLAKENQRLAFEPMDHRGVLGRAGSPTIGGVFAANVSGPRRISVGAARDFLLGVRFVDGRGQIVKNGGRVMKNVTGYDLVKLLSGACGTLGVLSEVSFKTLPCPEASATLILNGLTDAEAVAAMSRALGSPYEVTGAAHAQGQTALRIEGFASSVAYRIKALQGVLAACGAGFDVLEQEASEAHWRGLRDLAGFGEAPGDIWRLSCMPSQGPELAAKAGALAHQFDWGGGLVWLRMSAGTDVRARLGAFGGHATLIRAQPQVFAALGRFEPQAPALERLNAGLRQKFDPRGVLNPGLMGGVA